MSEAECQNKIPGLSRFSRTHKNPVMKNNLSTSVIVGDLKEFFFLVGGGVQVDKFSWGGEGAGQKKKSPDLSFPEVSISDRCYSTHPDVSVFLMSLPPDSLHLDD